jgi:hypothetical protein
MTRIRADKDERGEWPIRAYPRNPRLDFFGCGRRPRWAIRGIRDLSYFCRISFPFRVTRKR